MEYSESIEQEYQELYSFVIHGEVNHESLNEVISEYFPCAAEVTEEEAIVTFDCFGCFEAAVIEYVESEDEPQDQLYSLHITPYLNSAIYELIKDCELTSYSFDQETAVLDFYDLDLLKSFVVLYSDELSLYGSEE